MDIATLSDDDIIAEVRKLQYLYGLKREIRYAQSRTQDDSTESVAEHIYGMMVLAHYFLAYEDSEGKWDRAKVFSMITFHDIDEIETGDVLGYIKTEAQRAAEANAMHVVTAGAPAVLQAELRSVIDEYEARATPEARFVRAVDKFEPLVHLYNERGRAILQRNQTTIEQSRSIKDAYVAHCPSIKRFTEVLHERMVAEGYFYVAPEAVRG